MTSSAIQMRRRDTVARVGPPTAGRLSWFPADALALTDGASVPTWADQNGNANLTKVGGATVTYSAAGGPNSKPCVVFNETGGFNGTLAGDSGSVLAALYVIYNNFPTGPQSVKQGAGGGGGDFYAQEPGIGAWQIGGATGVVQGGSTSTSAWRIMLLIWNGASSAIYQNGGAAAATATLTGTNGTAMNVGGGAGAGSWNGKIAEVLWYTTAGLAPLNTAAAYLAAKYALTWTTAT